MNILLVCKLADSTLQENVLLPLLSSQTASHIYVLRDMPSPFHNERITYLCPSTKCNGSARHIDKTIQGIKAVKRFHIDAIIGVLNTPHGWIGRFISIITHTPYIHMTIAGHREFWVDGPWMEKFNLWLFSAAAAITVTGTKTQKYLLRKGYDEKRITILPNLPNEAFGHVPWKEKRPYDIVSFSRIDKNKNVILLIRALARLKEKIHPRVIIAGDGTELETIKQAVKQHQMEEWVRFVGYVSQIQQKIETLSNSTLFISCSKGEGFPVALLEAMACGCVPIVSDVGDISDVIEPDKNGLIYHDTDHEEELASLIEKLLLDKQLAQQMSKEAYQAREKYSISQNGRIWDKVLSSIATPSS